MTDGAPARDKRAETPSWARLVLLGTVCAAVAAAVRVWALSDLEAANPLFRVTVLDEKVYVREAARIHEGGAAAGPSLVSMLWPWVMAQFGAVTRHAASHLNVVLGSLVAGLAAVGAARMAGSLLAGGVAGAICALSGALVFQDTTAQIETLLALAVLSSVLAFAAASRSPTWLRLVAAGLATGIAILGRGTNAGLLLGMLPSLRGAGPRVGALRALVVVAAAAVPVLAFDAAVGAVPTSAGVNVWLGNNAWSRATRSFGSDEVAMDPDGEARDVARIAGEAEGRPLSTSEINAWWTRRAFREMSDDVGATLTHFAAKAALVFYDHDMGGNHDADIESGFADYLRFTPSFAVVALVFAAGFWVFASRAPGAGAAALALTGGLALLVVVFPLTRYRLPYVPAAAVLAAVGIAACNALGAPRRRNVVITLSVSAGLIGVSLGADQLRPPKHPESWRNLGVASIDSGIGDADAYLRRAVDEDPSFPPPSLYLGDRALERRDATAALRHLEHAIAAAGGRPAWQGVVRDATLARARALVTLGRNADALDAMELGIAQFPRDAALAAEGVFLAIAAGELGRARHWLESARRADATHARVLDAARALGN